MTKREQIMQALAALLANTPGVDGRVFRSREDALSREEAPALVLQWTSEDPELGTTGFTQKTLTVLVSVYQRAAVPDLAADPVVESVHSILMADTSLGGQAIDIDEAGTELELDAADQTACFVTMRFAVKYRHQHNSLSS